MSGLIRARCLLRRRGGLATIWWLSHQIIQRNIFPKPSIRRAGGFTLCSRSRRFWGLSRRTNEFYLSAWCWMRKARKCRNRKGRVLIRKKDLQDPSRRFLMILWTSFVYWRTYKEVELPLGSSTSKSRPKLVINKWILVKWSEVLSTVTKNLEKYDIVAAARALENFVVEDLSRWYIRRIREHMKHEKSDAAKECSATLGFVLLELSKTLAPFTPFISEGIYRGISGEKESVHLEDFPAFAKASASKPEKKLIEEMEKTREIVSRGLEARQKAGIKIRQPLSELKIKNKLDNELLELIKGEVNVKKVSVAKDLKEEVELDTEITNELQEEGLVREFIRAVQDFRKELKLTPQEKVELISTPS